MGVMRRSRGSMTKYQLVLMLALVGSTVTPSPANAHIRFNVPLKPGSTFNCVIS